MRKAYRGNKTAIQVTNSEILDNNLNNLTRLNRALLLAINNPCYMTNDLAFKFLNFRKEFR
jgi:hypothetical protein